jgi:fluoroacetyl-CoA thioesterase
MVERRSVPPMPVQSGLSATVELVVGEADTAIALHTGEVPVLATPRLLALCEEAALAAVAPELAEGQTTVGMKVQLDHLAPSAVGHRVVAEAVVERVNGRRVTFTVSVNDERGLVGVGRVTRVVVDAEHFVAKASGLLDD